MTLKCTECGKKADEVAAVWGELCRCGGRFRYPRLDWENAEDLGLSVDIFRNVSLTNFGDFDKCRKLNRPEQRKAFIEEMEKQMVKCNVKG